MISDHPGGGAKTPPGDGDRIAGASHADAHEQPVDGYAPGVAGPDDWLAVVARTAAADADAPIELLGEYLNILADAALSGRRPKKRELAAVRRLGRRAAEQGVDANPLGKTTTATPNAPGRTGPPPPGMRRQGRRNCTRIHAPDRMNRCGSRYPHQFEGRSAIFMRLPLT
jgi:hypothetical protein